MRKSLREQNAERVRDLVEGGEADPGVISVLIDRGGVAAARTLLDKLADGPAKTGLLNKLDAKEAVALLRKGAHAGARVLAGRLTKAAYILQAYPPIVEKCVAGKDQPCAAEVVRQAVRQLKQSDTTPQTLPPGVPASALPTRREHDPVLSSLCRLAQLVLPLDEALAFEVLREMVAAADASEVDTGQGRVGFEPEIFKGVARADGPRARHAALSFKDTLRQVVSPAAIYRWESEELHRRAPAPRPLPPPPAAP